MQTPRTTTVNPLAEYVATYFDGWVRYNARLHNRMVRAIRHHGVEAVERDARAILANQTTTER